MAKRADEWLELSQKIFNFVCYARLRFQRGTLHEKKEILATIGSNLVLKDKILSLTVPEPFIALQEAKVETDRIVARSKHKEKIDITAQMMYLYQQNDTLRRGWDSNPCELLTAQGISNPPQWTSYATSPFVYIEPETMNSELNQVIIYF